MRALLAQALMELRLTVRSGEGLLVTLILPPVLLIFFATLGLAPSDYSRPIEFLLPSMMALAVMSIGLVSLGIRTAYERHYGVLKRLGATPLGRGRLLGAKIASVFAIEILQVTVLVGVSALYGWRPSGSLPLALLVVFLGTATFASLWAYFLLARSALKQLWPWQMASICSSFCLAVLPGLWNNSANHSSGLASCSPQTHSLALSGKHLLLNLISLECNCSPFGFGR